MQPRWAALAQSPWLKRLLVVLTIVLVLTLAVTISLSGAGAPAELPWLPAALAWTRLISGIGLMIALSLWLVAGRMALAGLQEHAQLWERSIEALKVGVVLFDAEDRVVHSNSAYRALFPEIEGLIKPGALYSDLMRAYYSAASPDRAIGLTVDEFIEDGQRRRRAGGEVSEVVRFVRGRWIVMTDCRTADGGLIGFRTDVTEQKLIEHELSKRRKLIDDLAELSYDWFWRTDAEGRFVEFSAAMEGHVRIAQSELLGKRREKMPGFEADPKQLAEHRAVVARREKFPWFTYKARRGDGSTIWIAATGRPILDEYGTFLGYYGAGRDVTQHEEVLAALRQSEERFRSLTLLATDWYWEADRELRLTSMRGNPELEPRVAQHTLGRRFWEINVVDPDYPVDWDALRRQVEQRATFRRFKLRLKGRTGKVAYYELAGQAVYEGGEFVGYRGVASDATEREQLIARITESESRFRALTELSSDWFWEMDETLRFTSVRQGGLKPMTFDEREIIGKHRWDLPGEMIQPSSWDEHRAALLAHRPFRDVMFRRWLPDGSRAYTVISGDPVVDEEGRFRGYRGVGKDISDQVRAQERIERLASVDVLTQLSNRQTFDERAGRLLANAYAEGKRCALLFIDLDNFRLLNNGYGHRVGDQMLSIVASRMRDVIKEPHVLGRRGGDELVALLVDIVRPETAVEISQALIDAISEPARILGMEVTVTASVGISFFPQDGVDLDSLLNAADAAMYQAKDSGRRAYAFFTPTVARRVDLRLRLEHRLRKAVESRDFKLFFQPQVSLNDGKMVGAEALIRWRDAELGDISPAEFIPIAEESGLIVGLGDWVLHEACRARQEWNHLGLDIPPVSINMSGVQLRQLGCVEGLLEVLNVYGVAPAEVEVEVTETGLLDTSAVSRENLVRMRNAGVRLALDDFGVGFSSLAHLRDLPIHRLKIDRSFTVECMRDARTLTIVKAVIEMARSLGISVTAEGIETQAQQTWMQHLGCDAAQGYLFARPMPNDEFIKLFIERRGVGRERSLMH